MAWFDFLPLWNNSTTVPIPLNMRGVPPMPPLNYGPQDKWGVAGVQNAIFGAPHLYEGKLPPDIEARGPGFEIQKPPRQPVPAAESAPSRPPVPPVPTEGDFPFDPMTNGWLPPSTNVPPPQAPTAKPQAKNRFGADSVLWPILAQMGAGMAQPTLYGSMGAISQGLASGAEAAQTAPLRQLQMRKLRAETESIESKGDITKRAQEIAKTLPPNHPARGYFALGLIEKGLEQLTPDWNKLIVVGPDGKPQLNSTLMNAKAFIEAAGKWQHSVIGHDAGGKPIHGWVNPMQSMPSAPAPSTPSVPSAPSLAPPSVPAPSAGVATTSGPPLAPRGAVQPPPAGVDPYKWAEDQGKLLLQKQQGDAARKKTAPLIIEDIDRAVKLTEGQTLLGGTTGFMGALYRQIPGSPADNLNKLLDSVRANIGFDQLNQMRQQSPTGAALGAVQVEELRMLQSVMGSLSSSQTKDQLQFNLKRLKNAMLDVIHGPGNGPRDKMNSPGIQKQKTRSGITYQVE